MSIFVQIPSYRDRFLVGTIEELIVNAQKPQDLTIAICNQYHEDDDFGNLDAYRGDNRFHIIDVPCSESGGIGPAMYSIQQTYGGEDYSFRIDSHSLLAKHWDTKFVKMIKKLQAMGYPKPVLTAYAPDFDPTSSNPKSDKHPGYCSFQRFDPSSTVITQNSCLAEVMDYATDPVKIRFTSGHLIFSLGSFVEEVAYHPDIYFYGEELSLALRAFTCGYDLFAPNEVYLWHKYRADDPDAPRPWRDDEETYSLREFQSKTYLYSLLGLRGKKYRGKYGLGKARTLADYERYVGLDFKKQMASQHCLDNRPPPDPWNCWSELT